MPSSDHIIALGQDGQVIEQGSFARLQESGKYVQSLDVTDPHSDSDSETSSEKDIEEIEKSIESIEEEEVEQEMVEQGSVSSDRSTFKYYFGAMRPLSLAVGGAYVIGQAFSSTFRCK